MQNQGTVALIQIETPALPKPDNQLQHRNDKAAGEHQATPGAGRQRLTAMQVIERFAARALIRRAHGTAGAALAIQHQHHRQQQQAGELSGTGQAVKAIPSLVDSGGKGVEIEHRHRAEIRQGFHNRQGQTGTNGRTRHRQGNPPEGAPRAQAEHPRRLHQTLTLSQEGIARQQVDVGIEHQHQHDDHPAGGAHPREAHSTAKPLAQQALQRPGKIQQADKHKRQHIGGNGKRQHQRPVQPAAPRKLAQAGEPGQADAEQRHPYTHPQHQYQGIAEQPWQLGLPQVCPDFLVNLMPAEQQYAQRQQYQQGNGKGDGIPTALGGMGHAKSSNRLLDS